jgi:hypothetical protein
MDAELTSEQYEAIGRLTIGFNEIDWSLDIFLGMVINGGSEEIDEIILNQFRSTSQKWQLLDAFAAHIPKRYRNLSSECERVRSAIKEVEKISKTRNQLVHARAVKDLFTPQVDLRTARPRFGMVVSDAKSIRETAQMALRVCGELNASCEDLWIKLGEARDQEWAQMEARNRER